MALGKKSQAQAIQIAERREQALNLRRAGLSLRDIAKRLNVDPKTIHGDIRIMMAEAIKENVDNADGLRAMELERLDRLLLNIAPLLVKEGSRPPDLKAVNAAIKISEQRSKLLGLFMPTKQDVRVSGSLSWADMITQAQAAPLDTGASDDSDV